MRSIRLHQARRIGQSGTPLSCVVEVNYAVVVPPLMRKGTTNMPSRSHLEFSYVTPLGKSFRMELHPRPHRAHYNRIVEAESTLHHKRP